MVKSGLASLLRVVVLTRNPRGMASRFVARWAGAGAFEVVAVLFDEGATADRWVRVSRRWRRLRRVGPGGLAVGHALGHAYRRAGRIGAGPVDELGVPVIRLPTLAGPEAPAALRKANADVAVSLGNSLLLEATFAAPLLGTVNVHLGAVPEYRGGPPIFWELVDGRDRVGFTVHRMDAGIDTGPVLASGDVRIERRATLEETLSETLPRLHEAGVDALAGVLGAFAGGHDPGRPQPRRSRRIRSAPGVRDYARVRRSLAHTRVPVA